MVRNWMDAQCVKCPANGGQDFEFRVLIGNQAICPKCRRSVLKGPINLEKKDSVKEENLGNNNQGFRK